MYIAERLKTCSCGHEEELSAYTVMECIDNELEEDIIEIEFRVIYADGKKDIFYTTEDNEKKMLKSLFKLCPRLVYTRKVKRNEDGQVIEVIED